MSLSSRQINEVHVRPGDWKPIVAFLLLVVVSLYFIPAEPSTRSVLAAQAPEGQSAEARHQYERVIAFTDWTADIRSSGEVVETVVADADAWLHEQHSVNIISRLTSSDISSVCVNQSEQVHQYFVYTITIFYVEEPQ